MQVTIYFSAETRVDFRELVREVSTTLKTKVLLHQVGARDQAKMVGSIGPCGLTLCCATFLTEFAPISMKMAKDQSLFLNPVKFSGVCGKLMCCLRYEHETHTSKPKKKLPEIGAIVMSPEGTGESHGLEPAQRDRASYNYWKAGRNWNFRRRNCVLKRLVSVTTAGDVR